MKRNIVPHKNKAVIAVIIALTGLGLNQAHATRSPYPAISTILTGTSILNENNSGQTSGPFGVVTLTINTATQIADVKFDANPGFGFIDTNAAAINVAHSFNNVVLITDPDFKAFNLASHNIDGFGLFNLTVNNKNASTLIDVIEFSFHNTGTAWDSLDDVLAFNAHGVDAVAHVNFGNGLTGFAAESGPFNHNVPDGGTTVMLLGLGLSVLGAARRWLTA
jgi:protein with PEP-CTERM/exosortase system signal